MSTYQNSNKHKLSAANASKIALNTKVSCIYCAKDIVKASIKKHETGCYDNPDNLNHCKTCNIRIPHTNKFCSKSCAAKYNNRAFPKRFSSSFTCVACGNEKKLNKNSKGLYCNAICQKSHRWETVIKPSIIRGERINTSTIRKFIIERDGPGCSSCHNVSWLDKPLTMDVDNIDGDHRNNYPNNFRLLCPNCHRQTSTWGKKNQTVYGDTSLRYNPKK